MNRGYLALGLQLCWLWGYTGCKAGNHTLEAEEPLRCRADVDAMFNEAEAAAEKLIFRKPNKEKALELALLYTKACDCGSAKACLRDGTTWEMGVARPVKPKRALARYQKACAIGELEGCFREAALYAKGSLGSKDLKRAFSIYSKLCEKQYGKACFSVGYMYEYGEAEGGKNFELALSFYRKACTLNNGGACNNLGLNTKDKSEAKLLFEKSCRLEEGFGCLSLADFILEETPDTFLEAKYLGLACEYGAAEGCIPAAKTFGLLKTDEEGLKRSRYLYKVSCSLYRNKKSCKKVDALCRSGHLDVCIH